MTNLHTSFEASLVPNIMIPKLYKKVVKGHSSSVEMGSLDRSHINDNLTYNVHSDSVL